MVAHLISACYGRKALPVDILPNHLAKNFLHELEALKLSSNFIPALFDLYATAAFIAHQSQQEWIYCEKEHLYVKPYMNSCPACASRSRFVYVDGYKPKSHALGRLDRALAIIMAELIRRTGNNSLRGYLPQKRHTDLLWVDEQGRVAFPCEIKCGSLITVPLVAEAPEELRVEGMTGHRRCEVDPSTLRPCLLMPRTQGRAPILISLGCSAEQLDPQNVEGVFVDALCKKPSLFTEFLEAWWDLLGLYISKDKSDDAAFQINGCGRPSSERLDPSWPRTGTKARLHKEISNGKTTIGLSRSDDIKKAGGQLNRMIEVAQEAFPDGWKIMSSIFSNLSQFHMQHYISDVCKQQFQGSGGRSVRALKAIVTLDRSQVDEKRFQNIFSWGMVTELTPVDLEFGKEPSRMKGNFDTKYESHLFAELEEARRSAFEIFVSREGEDRITFHCERKVNTEALKNLAQMTEYVEDWLHEKEAAKFLIMTKRLPKKAILRFVRITS